MAFNRTPASEIAAEPFYLAAVCYLNLARENLVRVLLLLVFTGDCGKSERGSNRLLSFWRFVAIHRRIDHLP